LVSISQKLKFRCRRIVLFQLITCRSDNIFDVSKFGPLMNSFSLGNKIENLSDTNPTFIGAVYKCLYLLTYIIDA